MTSARTSPETGAIRPLELAVGLLALATGAIHAWIGWDYLQVGLTDSALIFFAMAAPYFAGLGLYAAGILRHELVRLAPLYVLVLLITWLFIGERSMLAYLTKAIELGLLAALIGLLYQDRQADLHEAD